jgi:adenylate cyclase
LDKAESLATANGELGTQAELLRIRGKLLLAAGEEAPAAQACFQRALDIARQQGARSWELRAATSMARLWKSQGRIENARSLLAKIYGWFSEGFETADLVEAKALLASLSSG